MTIEERLEKIEAMLTTLVERQQVSKGCSVEEDTRLAVREAISECLQTQGRAYYSVGEFAKLVHRTPYTVRVWCWRERINAEKLDGGAGPHGEWRISRKEFERYQREGLLPIRRQVG
ncbi:MAG TPA: helix-turn-helix domain-containing protein [Pirellulales bacterium]|nr:helix-turn-helix domain-containing protein [Pirellulales bacterium]